MTAMVVPQILAAADTYPRQAFGEASETLACDKPKGQDNVLWGSALPALAMVRPIAQGHRL